MSRANKNDAFDPHKPLLSTKGPQIKFDAEDPNMTFKSSGIHSDHSRGDLVSLSYHSASTIGAGEWKPRSETTYETLILTRSQFNSKVRGAGFKSDGGKRQIKKTCLLSKIRTRCLIREKNPALAVCITMYNEDE